MPDYGTKRIFGPNSQTSAFGMESVEKVESLAAQKNRRDEMDIFDQLNFATASPFRAR
jgi:hypothetical protein